MISLLCLVLCVSGVSSPYISYFSPYISYFSPYISYFSPYISYFSPHISYFSPYISYFSPYISYFSPYISYFRRCQWYGVATIRRNLKIIGLFCKRALQTRRYSANETYHSKEPTTHSHPIPIKKRLISQILAKRYELNIHATSLL